MEDIFIDRKKIDSKKIETLAYNPELYTLEIEFKNGDIIRYLGVPDYIFENFIHSPDKDIFFSKYIDHSGFSYEHVE